jgi:large subunit ribosomal protein L13
MIVDGTNLVLGRMASNVAKRLLNGERVYIVNAEKVVITGKKESAIVKFKRRIDLHAKGNPLKAPKFPRTPHGLVRMSIRGMLPFKRQTGKQAFKRLRVYIGVPEELKEAKLEKIEKAENKLASNYTLVEDISKALGAKW